MSTQLQTQPQKPDEPFYLEERSDWNEGYSRMTIEEASPGDRIDEQPTIQLKVYNADESCSIYLTREDWQRVEEYVLAIVLQPSDCVGILRNLFMAVGFSPVTEEARAELAEMREALQKLHGTIDSRLERARTEWANFDNWGYTDQVQINNKTVDVCARIEVLEEILREAGGTQ